MSDVDVQRMQLQQADLATIAKEEMAEVAVQDSLEFAADNALFTPMRIQRTFTSLSERTAKKSDTKKEEKTEEEQEVLPQIESIQSAAEEFHRENPELQSRTLLALRAKISVKDSPEEILQKVLQAYPDYSLADDALDFLIRTSPPRLAEKIKEAQKSFQSQYGREIRAGRNVSVLARKFSEEGIGSPTALRDLYRDVVGTPKDSASRFQELTDAYPFEKLKTVIGFILHSLGTDLKSKGPSIERGELSSLMLETKAMQAILGVYRFFKSRMPLIFSSYEREGYPIPTKITFEILSKLFVKLLLEKYPSAEKVYQIGLSLGMQEDVIAEAIIFTQMRDAVRYVAPRLFRSEQHRQDILALFIDVLQELDKDEDEEEEIND